MYVHNSLRPQFTLNLPEFASSLILASAVISINSIYFRIDQFDTSNAQSDSAQDKENLFLCN